MSYLLPTHPFIRNDDPLGILDTQDGMQKDVLDALLRDAQSRAASEQSTTNTLRTLVEDIAYTVQGKGNVDTRGLRDFLARRDATEKAEAVQNLLNATMSLSRLFPACTLSPLSKNGDTLECSGPQINALLAHQALGTLSQPEGTTWGLPDFIAWYRGDPPHRKAVEGYLITLFDHFAHGGYCEKSRFTFCMNIVENMPAPSLCHMRAKLYLRIVSEESEPSDMSEPTFILVAAHSQPGPGATATQEERLQNASLALSVSALLTPTIPDAAAVLTSAFPVHAAWVGHNRTARMETLYGANERPARHYILADALPLDEMEHDGDGLRDLQPGRAERELRKLYAAFSGAKRMQANMRRADKSCVIETGAWGCGAFGGNVLVKTMCMMVAAAMADVEVHLTLLEHRSLDIKEVQDLLNRDLTAAELWRTMTSSEAQRLTQPGMLLGG